MWTRTALWLVTKKDLFSSSKPIPRGWRGHAPEEEVCAQTRAAVILERNGDLEAGPTFSELKRGVGREDESYVPSETEGPAQKKRKTHS